MNKQSITDIKDLKGKRVLMRVDFNVPMDKEGHITDETRIVGAMKSIDYLYKNGAKVILCSHLGRPDGEFNPKFSLAPVAKRLAELVDTKVTMAKDVVGDDAKACIAAMKDGEIVMLENVRFHKEEELNDPGFSKQLASLADVYVNDAFGTAHRAHASTAGVAAYIPAVCRLPAGQKEARNHGQRARKPRPPLCRYSRRRKDLRQDRRSSQNLFEQVRFPRSSAAVWPTPSIKASGYEMGKSLRRRGQSLELCPRI